MAGLSSAKMLQLPHAALTTSTFPPCRKAPSLNRHSLRRQSTTHCIPSHPIPSHPIASHPIASHPIPSHRTRAGSATRRAGAPSCADVQQPRSSCTGDLAQLCPGPRWRRSSPCTTLLGLLVGISKTRGVSASALNWPCKSGAFLLARRQQSPSGSAPGVLLEEGSRPTAVHPQRCLVPAMESGGLCPSLHPAEKSCSASPSRWEGRPQHYCKNYAEKHFFSSALLLRLFLYYEHIKYAIKSIQVDIIKLNLMTHTTETKHLLNSLAQYTTNKSSKL